jgi:hypothetical protein
VRYFKNKLMKHLIIILIFVTNTFLVSFGQDLKIDESKSLEPQIKEWLKGIKRDSTDKSCKQLLTDFYDCFESDQGQANPLMITAMMNLFKYKDNLNLPNRQIAILLYYYINSVDKPQNALIWIRSLKVEYKNVYGTTHPLIYLYEGESLINSGQSSEAYSHFIEFQKKYPQSVTAMCYIYQTETDKNLAKTWLSILKVEHPNHWIVKQLKEN